MQSKKQKTKWNKIQKQFSKGFFSPVGDLSALTLEISYNVLPDSNADNTQMDHLWIGQK